MNRQEAIKILKHSCDYIGLLPSEFWDSDAGIIEAIDMAIEALMQESRKVTQESTQDQISRQDAIDALMNDSDWADAIPTIKSLPSADRPTEWIPVSEKLPKENEYVDNVCKYYLIQDEYGDMHVAHLSGRGWETIESIKALGCDVIAWMPLPKPYKGGDTE